MIGARALLGIAVTLFLGGPLFAQDTVRLRNGKVLVGTLSLDGDSRLGFTLKPWDADGTLFVLWTQVGPAEAVRLRDRLTGAAERPTEGEWIDAVRLVTPYRDIIGLILSESADRIEVKTRDGKQTLPTDAVVRRDSVKVLERDVYTADEMIARRAREISEQDSAGWVRVGRFAASLADYDRAKDFYTKALAAAEASKQGEIRALLESLELRMREDAAEKALERIWKLADDLKFDEAIEAARAFLADHADSATAQANPELLPSLEKQRAEFRENRGKVLAETLPAQWRRIRAALVNEAASLKNTIQQALELIPRLDEDIASRVAEKLGCTKEEAEKHWMARPQDKIRSVSLRDGTWIYKGGQDGGTDDGGGVEDARDQEGQGGRDPIEDFKRRYGNRGAQDKKKPAGKKIQTRQEWWESSSLSTRKEWIEAYYALTSSRVHKESEEEKNCGPCKGEGRVKAFRQGQYVEVLCSECHGVKKVLTLKYW
ncbi:MAG: hypothetical protein HY716_01615 [Planctomycetes bacterium]|nr:hypothetical protein [Planctomycetota bacterium]